MKPSLKSIPREYHFQYLSAYRNIMKVRQNLKGFMPQTPEEYKQLKKLIKDYQKYFIILSNINGEIKKNPKKLLENKI